MESMRVGTQAYPWHQYFERKNLRLEDRLDEALTETARSGLTLWEPSARLAAEVAPLASRIRAHGLEMPSLYSGGRLHEADEGGEVERLYGVGVALAESGGRILVVNPDPIAWGKPLDKDDAALRRQAAHFDRLGARLKPHGVTLAFHFHEPEWRAAGREVHHMMLATDPAHLSVCYDGHWLWQGCGRSQTMVEDFVKLYGDRVVSLHLRQSRDGVWHETFDDGDLDWKAPLALLAKAGFNGPAILEVAHHPGTAETLSMTDAHAKSADYARALWAEASRRN